MDKKEILYFEEDDAGTSGANGKQVFVAKRINGKTTHNKIEDIENKDSIKIKDIKEKMKKDKVENNEISIEIENFQIPDVKEKNNKTQKSKPTKKKNKEISKQKEKEDKRTKQRKKRRKILRIIILLMLITGAIIFALVSPIFNIEEITVEGNEQINSETIISLSGLKKGTNIFRIIESDIEKNIKENTYVDNVEINRSLPDKVELKVKEREILYQINIIDSYIYIDYQGYILDKSSEKKKLPIIEGFCTPNEDLLNKKRISSEDISYLNTLLKITENSKKMGIYDSIAKIIIQSNEYVLYIENEDKYVYLGNSSDIKNKILYVKTILENEKGKKGKIFVNGDLNSGFKPYFREEQTEIQVQPEVEGQQTEGKEDV